MGINVNNELPSELRQIAVSMREILGNRLSLQTVKQAHIANLQKSFTINDYKKYIDWFGKEVVLRTDKESYTATALDVTADGRLVVSRDGKIIEISSAEKPILRAAVRAISAFPSAEIYTDCLSEEIRASPTASTVYSPLLPGRTVTLPISET